MLSELSGGTDPICSNAGPDNAVFAMFTSGSTGTPKGAVWDHRTLRWSAKTNGQALRIGPETRVLQFSAFKWDNSVGEIVFTLVRGGCVCVPSEEDRLNNLSRAIRHFTVNWVIFTPSYARCIEPEDVAGLETLVLGGKL